MQQSNLNPNQNALNYIALVNQVFEIERKISKLNDSGTISRNIDKIRTLFSEAGLTYHDPIGETYNDTRTDCEAQVLTGGDGQKVITETIKPIVRLSNGGFTRIVQKAIVIVEENSQNKEV